MKHANYLKIVRTQYEELPYPPRDPQEEKKGLTISATCPLDLLNHYCFEGKQGFDKGFRILVAGGGTGDSTILLAEQLRETDAEIVYLDMSMASMKLAQKRAAIRGLTNIRFIHDSLLELPKLGLEQFDLVNCTGVLHHLADPDAGLAALNSVLKEDGVMAIMLYGTYGRYGVYQMQNILKRLNAGVTDTEIKLDHARKMVKSTEKIGWANIFQNPESDNVRYGDAGLYDLVLHEQDRAYTVPQLYEFLGKQGLKLRNFLGNQPGTGKIRYSPFYITDPSLHPLIRKMPLPEQQALAELILGNVSTHFFYASRKAVQFPKPQDIDMVPSLSLLFALGIKGLTAAEIHREFALAMASVQKDSMVIQHSKLQLTVPVTPNLKAILAAMDGTRSIGEICEKVRKDIRNIGREAPETEVLHKEFIQFYDAVHVMDIVLLRQKGLPPYASFRALQRRVTEKYTNA